MASRQFIRDTHFYTSSCSYEGTQPFHLGYRDSSLRMSSRVAVALLIRSEMLSLEAAQSSAWGRGSGGRRLNGETSGSPGARTSPFNVVDVDAGEGGSPEHDTPPSSFSTASNLVPSASQIKDAAVVSSGEVNVSLRNSSQCFHSLTSVAVDSCRLSLRRTGVVDDVDVEEAEDGRSWKHRRCPLSWRRRGHGISTRQGHDGYLIQDEPSTVDLDDDSSDETSPLFFSTQWRQEASVVLDDTYASLHRVLIGGAGTSFSYSDNCFVALLAHSCALVQAANRGASLEKQQVYTLPYDTNVNAVCMDHWGPHATLIGCSNGDLLVVDWREPASAGAPSLMVTVQQPSWLTYRSSRRVASSVAGVLSCCSMEDSFRVICSLGDARGPVVLADLRAPYEDTQGSSTGLHKRRRPNPQMERHRSLLSTETSCCRPTGRVVSEIRHSPTSFGVIGMVDIAGSTVLTTIAALEAGPMASADDEVVTAAVPRLLSAMPLPEAVVARLSGAPFPRSTPANLQRSGSAMVQQRTPSALHSRPRCTFTSDGEYLVSTSPASLKASFRPTPPRRGLQDQRCDAGLLVNEEIILDGREECQGREDNGGGDGMERGDHRASNNFVSPRHSTFIAISSLDGVVCMDSACGSAVSVSVE